MDIIKADNLGINFKVFRKTRGSLIDSLAGFLFNKRKLEDSLWALKSVSFTIQKGTVLGVIGRSGSGKSTLLRAIGGLCSPTEGRLEIQGTVSPMLTSTVGFQPDLSGVENIYFHGRKAGIKKPEIDSVLDRIIFLADIGDFINRPARTYTFDMYARLGYAITVSLKRDILLIDEAMEAGDAKFKQQSQAKLEELISSGRTIILISHHMETITRFASKVIWLEDGKLLAQGEPAKIVNQYLDSRLSGGNNLVKTGG
jgi:ABC-type polysaccharide/polyol phosphate transport system ATPase subunit